MRRATLTCSFATLLAAAPLAAQTPAGSQFRVNTTFGGSPSGVALDDGYVVVWVDVSDGADRNALGRLLSRRGASVGPEFRLNAYTTGWQGYPDVARAPGDRFVVAWSGEVDGGLSDVSARVFDRTGTPLTGDLRVNTYTTGLQTRPSIASDAAGNFVVVWNSDLQDGSAGGVFGRRFSLHGTPRGDEFQVNTATTGTQTTHNAAVAMDATGRFVVVWDGLGHVMAQRFEADGSRAGGEFQVDTSGGLGSGVDATPAGEFVIAWSHNAAVFARRFAPDGSALGGELEVIGQSLMNPSRAVPALDDAGNATIGWDNIPAFIVNIRRFFFHGAPRGPALFAGEGLNTRVASDPVGNLLVTWATFSGGDIFARRFGGLVPTSLAIDSAGNGVWEPGEAVDVRPSWHNINGAPLTFVAGLFSLTGPAGATYTMTDGAASYGTVADGSIGTCTDCFGLSVSVPATRPATHWDVTAGEVILPDTLGQMQLWRLHLGESFADVPRANPFYRFVETLLHHGVTSGCTATAYCPQDPTSRAQMAVFVLTAREGAHSTPAPCTTPVFNDVPPSSPFCPWIEELARRGVVAGCGGGAYCPAQAVTREQMAVFALLTLDPALDPPSCTAPVFPDVPAASPFCRWIEELARRGVVAGCGGGNYCPRAAVTRAEMGVFVSLTFGLTLYGP